MKFILKIIFSDMIFGLTGGTICAGRNSLSDFMVKLFGFQKVDIFQEWQKQLEQQ
jgi:hypothetical protein